MEVKGSGHFHDLNSVFGVRKTEDPAETRRRTEDVQQEKPQADRVAISQTARERQTIVDQLAEIPDIRESKVHAVQDAIERGQFPTEGKQVVGGIIRETVLNSLL